MTVSFRSEIKGKHKTKTRLSIAASTAFIVLLNGELIAFGPARAAHGYFYVNEYDLTDRLSDGKNILTARVVGYNINNFCYIDQPSFLCAEVVIDGEVVAFTDVDGTFDAVRCTERVTKIQKYSFQRPFAEGYRLNENAFAYERDLSAPVQTEALARTEEKTFLVREIPTGDYTRLYPEALFRRGTVGVSEKESYFNDRFIEGIDGRLQKGFGEDELEMKTHEDYGRVDFLTEVQADESHPTVIDLPADSYADLRFAKNYTGIFDLEFDTDGGDLLIAFDEVLSDDGKLDPFRLRVTNIVKAEAKKGGYRLTCAEPYVMKYVRLIALGGAVRIKNFKLVEVTYPKSRIVSKCVSDDPIMQGIYDAAVETFAANSTDIFMDCPSRERAGWIGDPYFTSRAAYILTGDSKLEASFLWNFILPDSFEYLPDGMFPMCYPCDHPDGTFLPTFAMWFVLELADHYFLRNGDPNLIEAAKDKVYALLAYFKKFENEYGLLERLESAVFIDWSRANELVQDVSCAANMLYSLCLEKIGALYGDDALIGKSAGIKATLRDMALTDKGFFADNFIRRDGKLMQYGESTEACQYYAFFCGVATPESHPWLWKTMIEDFGFERRTTGKYPEIAPANMIMGTFLRLDMLMNHGYHEQLRQNIGDYYGYMPAQTGTLWENVINGTKGSCNHNCASHTVYWMKGLGLVQTT